MAKRHGKTACFMPKPLFGDNGSGMHTTLVMGRRQAIAAGKGYAGLSRRPSYSMGGLLKHAPPSAGFCNPTTNSYKRLVPGYEAPVNLAYSSRNRSAAIRIPTYSRNPTRPSGSNSRCPDCSGRSRATFAATS